MSSAMQRAQRRQGRQAHNILMTRWLGGLGVGVAAVAPIVVAWPVGFALGAFAGISALILLVYSDPRN